jgi:hypothetical protein
MFEMLGWHGFFVTHSVLLLKMVKIHKSSKNCSEECGGMCGNIP